MFGQMKRGRDLKLCCRAHRAKRTAQIAMLHALCAMQILKGELTWQGF